MQENHRNGQDDSDIVETSEPFTIKQAALSRHIISSASYNWLKQGPANQPGDQISTSLSGAECSKKILTSFRWAKKCCLQTEENVAHKKLLAML